MSVRAFMISEIPVIPPEERFAGSMKSEMPSE